MRGRIKMKKNKNKVAVIMCLCMLLVTGISAFAATDIYEPNNDLDSARTIYPHLFPAQGTISYSGDCDYFKFVPNGSGYLTLKLTPPSGKGMYMRVSRKDEWVPPFAETLLGEVGTSGTPVDLPIKVTEGVTYYIRIDGEQSNESYTIGKQTFNYSKDAAYEDNNSPETAHEININNSSIMATINSTEDVDYYKFYSEKTETIKFMLSAPSNKSYQVFVVDQENGSVIGQGNTIGQIAEFNCSLVKNRAYKVIVHGMYGNYMSNVPYQLSFLR